MEIDDIVSNGKLPRLGRVVLQSKPLTKEEGRHLAADARQLSPPKSSLLGRGFQSSLGPRTNLLPTPARNSKNHKTQTSILSKQEQQ
jgi:hypothetical protein